ncbi:protein-disulfide isomerase [Bosea psychrotolerans]|uniref:Protein-disulfide isomerase n=1 Tax=Bosea psychrotolerans TaxID=1871628 RepID=A0A2S4MCH7_9HYPH|nr:DsbA family protein [Bosea psychrotolerans]POR52442.1 protein-disulfide isomerase [Bosea psychrotolerans]
MNRRTLISRLAGLSASGILAAICPALVGIPAALGQEVDSDAILNDPEAPTAGNPKGDVTIVAFLDYNCPFCKKSAPDLDRIVKTDGKIRLVYKDWPILTEASVYGAQLAIAAHYQAQYDAVHHALMGIPGMRISKETMLEAVKASGVDMVRLQADLGARADAITALLRRNLAQADSIGLQGTPAYLVGPFRTSTLDYAGFKQIVTDARAKQAAK